MPPKRNRLPTAFEPTRLDEFSEGDAVWTNKDWFALLELRVDVKPDLAFKGFPRVYALGDFANFRQEDGKALPQLASVAQQAGKHCARNITADAGGDPGTPFKYFDKGIMAMIGRNAAAAEVGSNHHALTGPSAFAAWLGVHALLLTTVRARFETFLE